MLFRSAGDATTVPYKQIVIASGEGAKAALSAFDYLIRTPAPNPATASGQGDERSTANRVIEEPQAA